MGMITNIEVVPHETVPGRKVQCREFQVPNYRLHLVTAALSRTMIGCIENQSNNMGGEVVPREVAQLRLGYASALEHWQDAKNLNNPPTPAHEFDHAIFLPSGNEIGRMQSYKMQVCVKELKNLALIIIDSDAAKATANVGNPSVSRIDEAFLNCTAILEKWIGGGRDNDDIGIAVPAYLHVGSLNPDVDKDFQGVREPSADMPSSGRPDVPDTLFSNGD